MKELEAVKKQNEDAEEKMARLEKNVARLEATKTLEADIAKHEKKMAEYTKRVLEGNENKNTLLL